MPILRVITVLDFSTGKSLYYQMQTVSIAPDKALFINKIINIFSKTYVVGTQLKVPLIQTYGKMYRNH